MPQQTIRSYGKYDFAFDQMVDGQAVGALTGGMMLRVLTVATDPAEKNKLRLMAESAGQAIVVLAENSYYHKRKLLSYISWETEQKHLFTNHAISCHKLFTEELALFY